jgi:hypothetical protein
VGSWTLKAKRIKIEDVHAGIDNSYAFSKKRHGTMNEQIAQRIARQVGVSNLAELLSDKVSGSDLHSLLLAVLKRRVGKMDVSKLTQPSPVNEPCNLDARLLNKLEQIAYETASAFEAIELSPLSPLGAVAVLSGLDQGNVLSTVRAFECASDPTIGLALECARRRKNPPDRKDPTLLCTSQRVVRFPMPETPGFTAHFKLFGLVSAGRDVGSFTFEAHALRQHIDLYLSLLSKLAAADFAFEDIVVELSDTRVVSHLCSKFNISRDDIKTSVRARDPNSSTRLLEQQSSLWQKVVTKPAEELTQYHLPKHLIMQLTLLEEAVCAPLAAAHKDVRFEFNMHRLTGLGYYEGPCFHIRLKNDRGEGFMLADGGFVAWTQQLLGDGKERLMTSAIGTELMCRIFRRTVTNR